MKFSLLATALVAGVTAVVGTAATARGTVTPGVVTVSCFRGPWTEVIWDRPNPVFVDSLVAVGYDFPTAQAIATRVCKDIAGVGNPDHVKARMEQALHESPQWMKKR